jgi:RNA-binding protein Musashi
MSVLGFGFVTFEKPGPAAKVCNIQFHDLKNKRVEVKVAQTKEALAQQADKARAAALNQSYTSAAAAFNFSPTYPQSFYPHYPLAYYGGYGYHGDHHLPSPPFFPPGFNGLPSPYFMRGLSDPSGVPLGSPDFLSDQFQSLAIMSNPYMSPTGSPPHGYPVSLTAGNFTNGGGSDAVGSNYSPPNSLSTKGNIPSDAIPPPANGYTQVPSYQPSSNTSAPLPQPAV